jgi:hypothetical protein
MFANFKKQSMISSKRLAHGIMNHALFLLTLGETSLFVLQSANHLEYMLVYVDGLIITGDY